MKKFKFKLHAVLREREIREDFEKRKVAECLLALKKEDKILSDYFEKVKKTSLDFSIEKSKAEPNVKRLSEFEFYLIFLKKQIIIQKSKIVDADKKLKVAQRDLENAMKRRKIISKLEDKKRLSYYMDISKAENKELDEYNVLKVSHE